jgi:hypothetical protein
MKRLITKTRIGNSWTRSSNKTIPSFPTRGLYEHKSVVMKGARQHFMVSQPYYRRIPQTRNFTSDVGNTAPPHPAKWRHHDIIITLFSGNITTKAIQWCYTETFPPFISMIYSGNSYSRYFSTTVRKKYKQLWINIYISEPTTVKFLGSNSALCTGKFSVDTYSDLLSHAKRKLHHTFLQTAYGI